MSSRGADMDSEDFDVGDPVGLTVCCFGALPQPPSDLMSDPSAQVPGICESGLVQWSCHIAGRWTRGFTPMPALSVMVHHDTGD